MELLVRSVSKAFGGNRILSDVTFGAKTAEITALIGPNGAGKTTMFNCISGFLAPDQGSVLLGGSDIRGLAPHVILRNGLARTFQLTKPFSGLNVLETVMVSGHWRSGQTFGRTIFALPSTRRSERRLRQEAQETLETLGIGDLGQTQAQHLPYGQQRLVEIAKVLATGAKTLLLDEPAAGLHVSEVEALDRVLRKLRGVGKTILMVEHNMGLTFGVADHVVVLDYGSIIARGTPSEIQLNANVMESYLGKQAGDARNQHGGVGVS